MRVSVAARLAMVVIAAAVPLSCGSPAVVAVPATSAPASPTAMPAAHPVAPDRRVGAVFLGGGALHVCSGSVLDAGSKDLMLTAAHCLDGGADATFVPGFADGSDATEGWHVDAVYLDPRWVQEQDPAADFAVARVSRADGASLEGTAGGGLTPGPAPRPGTEVTVIGYGAGTGGPASCRAPATASPYGFPEVHCDGLVAGFSGAPWINGSTVAGVVGGLHGGGCADAVSYSPPFDGAVDALVARAEAGGPGDEVPAAPDDGCDPTA
ncbi:Trypsin [Mycolicibacterium chubuense NBB4]|uniref:Trypsin n=1 Tax=Mycolicibacterium chubuense (strain NBB4) TaxID=710421 RepID=I4BI20_MYCCN|nr:serine protease [Mycolicibacterium chubuense]AFM16927.1 Trypsin [Mycolicibacterium chubuense NBB4]